MPELALLRSEHRMSAKSETQTRHIMIAALKHASLRELASSANPTVLRSARDRDLD